MGMHSILVPRIESAANMPPSPAGDSNHGFARISVLLGSHSEAFRPSLTLTLSQRERECMAWITTVRDSRPLPRGEGMGRAVAIDQLEEISGLSGKKVRRFRMNPNSRGNKDTNQGKSETR